jgi:hypothetical protein
VIDTPVRDTSEIERVIGAFAINPSGGLLLTGPHPTTVLDAILRFAVRYRLPTMFSAAKLVREGLLALADKVIE